MELCVFGGYDGKASKRNDSKGHFKDAVPLCCEFDVVFGLRQNGRDDILWFAMVLRPF